MKRLDKIVLYSIPDLKMVNSAPTPIKTVHFDYDYSLCGGIPNSATNEGKLTLTKLWFTYGTSAKGQLSPYQFTYGPNPNYNLKDYDRWGNYFPNDCTGATPNTSDFPYVQAKRPALFG